MAINRLFICPSGFSRQTFYRATLLRIAVLCRLIASHSTHRSPAVTENTYIHLYQEVFLGCLKKHESWVHLSWTLYRGLDQETRPGGESWVQFTSAGCSGRRRIGLVEPWLPTCPSWMSAESRAVTWTVSEFSLGSRFNGLLRWMGEPATCLFDRRGSNLSQSLVFAFYMREPKHGVFGEVNWI